MSYNYYTNAVDVRELGRIAEWSGRPLLLSEFYWSSSRDSGLSGGKEVASQADFLVHVVDCAAPDPEGQINAVREVLGEIDALSVPELLVFNKADIAPDVAADLQARHQGSVALSAQTGEGIEHFLHVLGDRLRSITAVVELMVPYERGDVLASIHREGEVVSTFHDTDGVRVRARLADASVGRLAEFVVHSA